MAGRRFNVGWLRDVVAAAYVAVVLDAARGRLQSPKAEAVFSAISTLYSAMYAGGGDPEAGFERLVFDTGWLVDGAAASRALIYSTLGMEAGAAWEALRSLLDGRLPTHWAMRGLLEALQARGVKPHQLAKWASDPTSIGVRFYNVDLDGLPERLLEELPGRLPVRRVEAGRMLYDAARRAVEKAKVYQERVAASVKKLRLRGL